MNDLVPPRPHLHTRPASSEEARFYDQLIRELAERRREVGISQAALDHQLGVSEGMIAKWETRARLPGAFFFMCWCKSLGVQLTLTKGLHE